MKTEFQKILLLFSKFMIRNFFLFYKIQLQSVEYSVYVLLEILKLVIGIILRFYNRSLMQLHAARNSATYNRNSVTHAEKRSVKFTGSSVLIWTT